jgi:hypothetical protein
VCASNDLALFPKLIAWFSEPVNVPSPEPFEVRANGAATSCALIAAPTPQYPMAEFTCSPPVPTDADVQVTVGTGVTAAAGGLPLVSATGSIPLSVTIPPLDQGATCRIFRETRIPQ